MKTSILTATLLISCACTAKLAADELVDDNEHHATRAVPLGSTPPDHLGFLAADQDYQISFPPEYGMFKTKTGGVVRPTYTTEDGEKGRLPPSKWSATRQVTFFRIVRFGGGSWVLLEHPANPDDIANWNAQRRAMAALTDPAQFDSDSEEDQQRLEKVRQNADQEIETAETWINLDHALAIGEVPTKDAKLKWTLQSIETAAKK